MDQRSKVLGCTSMVLWDHSLESAVEILAQAGYGAIEIWGDHLQKTEESPQRIRTALERTGLSCTVHCPIIDVNICSTNRVMAETSLRLYLETLAAAVDMEALLLVFHAGNLFSTFDPLDQYWQILEYSLGTVLQNKGPVHVVVENMEIDKSKEVVKEAGDLGRLLDLFSDHDLGICWDTTHLISTARNLAFLDQIPRIDHVHISDAQNYPDRPAHKHLRLGEGELDFTRLFAHPTAAQPDVVSLETVIVDPTLEDLIKERKRLETILAKDRK